MKDNKLVLKMMKMTIEQYGNQLLILSVFSSLLTFAMMSCLEIKYLKVASIILELLVFGGASLYFSNSSIYLSFIISYSAFTYLLHGIVAILNL